MKLVYIAGPYGDAGGFDIIHRNIQTARSYAVEIAKMGVGFFCPHLNSAHFEKDCPEIPVEFWQEMDIGFLGTCDAVFLLPGWEGSKGTARELEEWKKLVDGPVFTSFGPLLEWINA